MEGGIDGKQTVGATFVRSSVSAAMPVLLGVFVFGVYGGSRTQLEFGLCCGYKLIGCRTYSGKELYSSSSATPSMTVVGRVSF